MQKNDMQSKNRGVKKKVGSIIITYLSELNTRYWVFFVVFISIVFLIIGILNLNAYWETTDEKSDQLIGRYYYNEWAINGKDGLERSLTKVQRNYGPFFDYIVIASHDLLYRKTQIVKNEVAAYHVPTLITSSLLILIVGIFARYLFSPQVGTLSALLLALLPRFIGDSQNNPKDIPLAALYTISIFLYYLAIRKKVIVYFILAGICSGLTYSTKVNGLLIFPTVGVYFLYVTAANKKIKSLIKDIFYGFVSIGTFLATILVVWPYYRFETINRFEETFNTFQKHEWNDYVLYLGRHFRGQEVPWHYPFVIIGVTIPAWYLLFFFVGTFIGVWQICRYGSRRSSFVLIFAWLTFAVLIQAISSAPMYDGIRHFMSAIPPLCIMTAFGISFFSTHIPRRFQPYYYSFVTLALLLLLAKNIAIHPYQIVYFNELIGGTKGAYRKFDLDYWGQSLKEGADWINSNAKEGSLVYLPIPMAHHFPIDRSKFNLVSKNYDYKVSLIRGMLHTWDQTEDYLNPKKKPIHEIVVDGAPILQIFYYPENATVSHVVPLEGFILPQGTKAGIKRTIYDTVEKTQTTEIANTLQMSCFEKNQYFEKNIVALSSAYWNVNKAGIYCFKVYSDDDSQFSLNGQKILKAGSMNGVMKSIRLEKGTYLFEGRFENTAGKACLSLELSDSDCPGAIFKPFEKDQELFVQM